jgi:hypothetical protein
LPIPANWAFDGERYHYNNQRGTLSTYPLPTGNGNHSSCLISPRFLFCRTKRGFFKSTHLIPPAFSIDGRRLKPNAWGTSTLTTSLVDDRDNCIVGFLNLSLDTTEEPPEGTAFELVAISVGSLFGRGARSSKVADFCYVLWIGWKDGVAYRRGLGRVLQEAWDLQATEEINLVLG